jgi:hypothetical protein
MIGISVYTGMGDSLEKNLSYIEMANSYGVKTVFTSLHIPEANENVYFETEKILNKTKELGVQVIADISKGFVDKFDFEAYNIYALRLDFGFGIEEVVSFTKKYPFKIQINGSTVSREYLHELRRMGADFENIEIGHNYYPRRDTGISYDLLLERNKIFKEFDLRIMAFISSRGGKRGPIYEGLPTLECHRDVNPIVAAQHLLQADVDLVVIGDAFALEEEIKKLSEISKTTFTLPFKAINISEAEGKVLAGIHTNRMDPGEYVIRSQEARGKKTLPIINKNSIERKKYSVTIDNEGYLRYEGELQITRKDLLADVRVNVVGDATEAALLIDLIKPGDAFRLDCNL